MALTLRGIASGLAGGLEGGLEGYIGRQDFEAKQAERQRAAELHKYQVQQMKQKLEPFWVNVSGMKFAANAMKSSADESVIKLYQKEFGTRLKDMMGLIKGPQTVSYTHLRAHET